MSVHASAGWGESQQSTGCVLGKVLTSEINEQDYKAEIFETVNSFRREVEQLAMSNPSWKPSSLE